MTTFKEKQCGVFLLPSPFHTAVLESRLRDQQKRALLSTLISGSLISFWWYPEVEIGGLSCPKLKPKSRIWNIDGFLFLLKNNQIVPVTKKITLAVLLTALPKYLTLYQSWNKIKYQTINWKVLAKCTQPPTVIPYGSHSIPVDVTWH